MTAQQKKQRKLLQEALADFPRIVAQKKKRAEQRKRFVKETFGGLVRELEKRKKVAAKSRA